MHFTRVCGRTYHNQVKEQHWASNIGHRDNTINHLPTAHDDKSAHPTKWYRSFLIYTSVLSYVLLTGLLWIFCQCDSWILETTFHREQPQQLWVHIRQHNFKQRYSVTMKEVRLTGDGNRTICCPFGCLWVPSTQLIPYSHSHCHTPTNSYLHSQKWEETGREEKGTGRRSGGETEEYRERIRKLGITHALNHTHMVVSHSLRKGESMCGHVELSFTCWILLVC